MLQPKRMKFRKMMKGRNRGLAHRGSKISFGEYGLKATGRGRITARQIEAGRRAITRHVKRGGKIWIRVFPDKPISKKPLEVRMGKGKGSVEYWVAQIQPGRVLYEIEGVSEELAREAFELAAQKMPLSTTLCETDGDVMKAQEIREKSAGELQEQLLELLREQFNLRMQKATGQLSQTHLLKQVRRDIARVKTLLNEKAGD
ncbi:hypothetical protein HSBAA_03170 [Vreelandella sulfidaeris]|uniref:Multifunctional fusion protein n=15 Tax=Gammaproteobacteria TaxID=1236 RepID=A0A455U3F8_9GAMM|nr:hypothetical protein HSBAA_03170 [Halomonas sulfidaeris]